MTPYDEVYDEVKRVKRRENISAENEEEIKSQIVFPILKSLKWNHWDGTKVRVEYPVGRSKTKRRADLVLLHEEKELIIMEIKNETIDLDKETEQLFGYAFHASIEIGILTNGYKWRFYSLFSKEHDVNDKCFAEIDIEKEEIKGIVDKFDNYLSYASLTSRDAMDLAKSALCDKKKRKKLRDQLPHLWKEILKAPPTNLVELVKQEVQRKNLQHYEEVIAEFLKEQSEKVFNNRPQTYGSSPTQAFKVNKKRRSSGRKILAYRLFGRRKQVDKWTDMWRDIALQIYEREEGRFHLVCDSRGPKSYVDVERGRMKSPHLIPKSEYFIELHGSADALERRCKNLLAIFGYPEEQLEIEYE